MNEFVCKPVREEFFGIRKALYGMAPVLPVPAMSPVSSVPPVPVPAGSASVAHSDADDASTLDPSRSYSSFPQPMQEFKGAQVEHLKVVSESRCAYVCFHTRLGAARAFRRLTLRPITLQGSVILVRYLRYVLHCSTFRFFCFLFSLYMIHITCHSRIILRI